jgi:HD superfamily phosphohydrolase
MSGKLIRDAVYGDIHLGALEIELIDTPEFQRLRGIKQLGTA